MSKLLKLGELFENDAINSEIKKIFSQDKCIHESQLFQTFDNE